MAETTDSISVPAPHGPVTAAIRAVAAEHDPTRSGVVWLAKERSRRGPTFTPIAFGFPLTNAAWSATYLPAVRFAADFLAMRGPEAVSRIAAVGFVDPRSVPDTIATLTTAIEELEKMAEAVRTARGRLRETGAHLGLCRAGRVGL